MTSGKIQDPITASTRCWFVVAFGLVIALSHARDATGADVKVNLGLFHFDTQLDAPSCDGDDDSDVEHANAAEPSASKRGNVEQLLEPVPFQLRTENKTLSDEDDTEVAPKTNSERKRQKRSSKAKKHSEEASKGDAVELESGDKESPTLFKHRWVEGSWDWVFRSGDNGLGMFTIKSSPSRELELNAPSHFNIEFEYGVHFLSGPAKSDLPPRLFDLYFNVHWLQHLGAGIGFDANFDLGLYTDFEDTSRPGWRFPGRAIGFWNLNGEASDSEFTLIGGLESFDTDALRVVPAGGIIWQPTESTRFEFYFPRPQIKLRLNHDDEDELWLYARGELLGSAWAIERSNGAADVANLTERRVALGIESRSLTKEGSTTFMEIGYVFDRQLEYRSGHGNMNLDDAMMFRMGSRY